MNVQLLTDKYPSYNHLRSLRLAIMNNDIDMVSKVPNLDISWKHLVSYIRSIEMARLFLHIANTTQPGMKSYISNIVSQWEMFLSMDKNMIMTSFSFLQLDTFLAYDILEKNEWMKNRDYISKLNMELYNLSDRAIYWLHKNGYLLEQYDHIINDNASDLKLLLNDRGTPIPLSKEESCTILRMDALSIALDPSFDPAWKQDSSILVYLRGRILKHVISSNMANILIPVFDIKDGYNLYYLVENLLLDTSISSSKLMAFLLGISIHAGWIEFLHHINDNNFIPSASYRGINNQKSYEYLANKGFHPEWFKQLPSGPTVCLQWKKIVPNIAVYHFDIKYVTMIMRKYRNYMDTHMINALIQWVRQHRNIDDVNAIINSLSMN